MLKLVILMMSVGPLYIIFQSLLFIWDLYIYILFRLFQDLSHTVWIFNGSSPM